MERPPIIIDLEEVRARAFREFRKECIDRAVAEEKQRILARRWWHKLFPYVITITRR